MTTEPLTKKELIKTIHDAISQLQELMDHLDEEETNKIPYKDSWTAGQLFRHIIKSNLGISAAMIKPGKIAKRDPEEKIPGLKKTFLDFLHKLDSPDFIVPENGPYDKQAIMKDLAASFEVLKHNTKDANLKELVEGLPFGEVTKLELLHFVLYHTQRHLHQMRKICETFRT